MVKKLIKNENKVVSPIGLLLANDAKENVFGEYLDRNKLNFTINSLKDVDNYLDKIRKNKRKLNEYDLKKIVLRCGTYLGEVIRKLKPNRFMWISYPTATKINEKPLLVDQDITTIYIIYDKIHDRFWFPLGKPYKFLDSGKADNLWSFATTCLKFKESATKDKNKLKK